MRSAAATQKPTGWHHAPTNPASEFQAPGPTEDFRRELLHLGIIAYHEQDTVWSIAKRCAATSGLPLGAAIGIASMQAGTVVVPGFGTLSGGLAGFLAGLAAGTAMCTAANLTYRKELRQLLD